MRIFAAVKNSDILLLSLAVPFVAALAFSSRADAANLGVVLCGSQSAITISQPEGDSIVTEPDVLIKGTVSQAAQIEVTLDDVFNNVAPLNLGQTTYETLVHLTPGTHTIKLAAINMCDSGDDGSATLVVTYSPPPERNSDGEVIINPADSGDGINAGQLEAPKEAGWFTPLRDGLDVVLRTLDIRSFDDRYRYSQLSIVRAIILGTGLYLIVFGAVNRRLARLVIVLPLIRNVSAQAMLRKKVARWVIRSVGIILFVGALLL